MREGLPSVAAHGRGIGQLGYFCALAQAVVFLQDAQREVLQQLRLVRHYAPVGAHLRAKFRLWAEHPTLSAALWSLVSS